MTSSNLFSNLPATMSDELMTTLLEAPDLRIERIVSCGQASPEDFWYDQDQHEWVIVLRGAARLQLESETFEMMAGDFVNIPAHKRHRVEWTDPEQLTIWLAVFYGPAQ